MRINLVMEFSAENAWFAMTLFKMGARIKWASNNRYGGVKKTAAPKKKRRNASKNVEEEVDDELAVIQAVAVMS